MKTIAKGLLFLSLLSIITTKTENNTEISAIKEQLDRIAQEKQDKKAKKEQEQKERTKQREITNEREKGILFGALFVATFFGILAILKYFQHLKFDIWAIKSEIESLRKYDIKSLENDIEHTKKWISSDISSLERTILNRIINFLPNK